MSITVLRFADGRSGSQEEEISDLINASKEVEGALSQGRDLRAGGRSAHL